MPLVALALGAEYWLALATALWLGILMSISPCPLATNIVAISFLSRRIQSTAKVFGAGLLYTLGRCTAYVIIGGLLVGGLVGAPALSQFVQNYMNKLLGPILILTGMLLLEMLAFAPRGRGFSDTFQKRVEAWGLCGAFLLGLVFAASFCPISATLFFGSLLATAVKVRSVLLVPAAFGLGSALPVLGFVGLIAAGAKSVGRTYERLKSFERRARRLTGTLFVAVGIFYCLRYILQIL